VRVILVRLDAVFSRISHFLTHLLRLILCHDKA
jgi:hypothetical protein